MSSIVLTQALIANQVATFPMGRIFNILSAPGGSLNITAERRAVSGGQTQPRVFNNVPAGTKFTADKGDEWTYLRVTSTVNQTVQIFVGDEDLQFNQAVTVTGSVNVAQTPVGTVTDHADVAVAGLGTDSTIVANASRRSVTVGSLSTNAPAAGKNLRVRAHGSAAGGYELQPGTNINIQYNGALDIVNPDAGAQTYYWQEYGP